MHRVTATQKAIYRVAENKAYKYLIQDEATGSSYRMKAFVIIAV